MNYQTYEIFKAVVEALARDSAEYNRLIILLEDYLTYTNQQCIILSTYEKRFTNHTRPKHTRF